MGLADWIVVAIVILIMSLVIGYIIHEKRKGVKCIGCPDSKKCSENKKRCCGNNRQV